MTLFAGAARHYDILGIGFGPSNIALAIALEETGSKLKAHFIDAAPSANWHPGMLLDGSDIQNNPLRDLVTPRNPRSQYTFVNYLKEEGRLFDFLNLGLLYPLRKDYAGYVRWVAKHFDHQVSYATPAREVRYDAKSKLWVVETSEGAMTAKALLVGTGRSHNIPEIFVPHLGARVFHLCHYLNRMEELAPSLNAIAVIGASQSAVEIHNDLLARFPKLEIHAVHRGYSMRQKDTSPFSDHVYFPEFVEYFFKIDAEARADLQRQLRPTNYNSADLDVLHKLYVTLYEERLDGRNRFHLHNNIAIEHVAATPSDVTLTLRERFLGETRDVKVDAVVLATGFKDIGSGEGKELYPRLLESVAGQLERDAQGALLVQRDYSVRSESGLPLYLNGLCESSHGLGDAGSFSLLSLRSVEILDSINSYFRESKTQNNEKVAAVA